MKQTYKRYSIGKTAAINLASVPWWKKLKDIDIARFQFSIEELSMPFGDFHEAIEKAVGHPVFTHQFVTCEDMLWKELFQGEKQPTLAELINLLPKKYRNFVS